MGCELVTGVQTCALPICAVFSQQVRFIGAGTSGVAALWTLLKIIGPIVKGIQGSIASSRARGHGEVVELGERDLSFNIVVGTILGSLVPIAGLLWFFAQGGPIAANPVAVISATLLFLLFRSEEHKSELQSLMRN